MKWTTATRYKLLLELNNAIATRKTKEDLFRCLSQELHKHFKFDRLSVILYDSESNSITNFAAADGVQAGGVVALKSRPLANGAIAQIAIKSGQPIIFDDLTRYTDLSSVGELVKAGLTSTLAFPMLLRGKTLGSIHFSYRKKPDAITELTEVLKDVSQQIAIAVENMLSYTSLKEKNLHLQEENQFLLTSTSDYQEKDFVCRSIAMKQLMAILSQVATTSETILLSGETGTGKDYLARMIHEKSKRAKQYFVKINCPGLSSSLFESELFGHAKGAFTGAEKQRIGRFELADKGTLFLDEIGELSLGLQAKLLQVLQEKSFERVGESKSTPVDVRIIAATNKDLLESIKNGGFRQDLFYRIDTVTIKVPPLRDRKEDIPHLLARITTSEANRMRRTAPAYNDCVLSLLSEYSWPGNVRELKNMVKRFIILQPGETIDAGDIEKDFLVTSDSRKKGDVVLTLKQSERNHIIEALTTTNGIIGGKKGAAHLLGIPRTTLNYRIKKLSIAPEDYQNQA